MEIKIIKDSKNRDDVVNFSSILLVNENRVTKFKNQTNSEKLAEQLLNQLSFSVANISPVQQRVIDNEMKKYPNRADLLERVIELVENQKNPDNLKVLATAYTLLGSAYREKAIYYHQKLFMNFDSDGNMLIGYLDLLEKEYRFSEAVNIYKTLIYIDPVFPGYYSSLARILVKLNQIDDAIILLKDAKKLSYYKGYKDKYQPTGHNHDFKQVIDRALEDVLSKKENGYIYKPRPRKTIIKT